jgi:nucleoside 2-deoxyribosyltransferase
MNIYLASAYGFSDSTKVFMNQVLIPILEKHGHTVLNPWDLANDLQEKISQTSAISNYFERQTAYAGINNEIAKRNELAIRDSQIVLAVLDGQEVDSGVSAETGFAYALGKKVIGYRGDFRMSGENIGCKVNLQLQYFIESSGGRIVTSLDELPRALE